MRAIVTTYDTVRLINEIEGFLVGKNSHANQRSHLPANRELRRAISADRPRSFGIRRLVEDETNGKLVKAWDDLTFSGDIPTKMNPRLHTGVTLLPRRVLGKQLTQGLVIGYKLGHAKHNLIGDHELSNNRDVLHVKFGNVAMLHRRLAYLEVESDELQLERERVFGVLGSLGFKGARKSLAKPLHISLGESDSLVSRVEERHVIEKLNEKVGAVLNGVDTIELQQWQIYPTFEQVSEL